MSRQEFNASSTAAGVLEGVDLSGRRAVVTGASSGIGTETTRALAAAGADVTLAVRNVEVGNRVAQELRAGLGAGTGKLQVMRLDLADFGSVCAFAAAWSGPLHILVNNAGMMAPPKLTRSPQGWEAQFATNHMGHFALALQLHTALAAAKGALLAGSPLVAGLSGRYFEDCAEATVVPDRGDRTSGVEAYALDQDNATQLWKVSEELLKRAG